MEEGIPKQVGRYTVDRLLGSGAMGYVFLGRDPELDRPVAIKTVRDLGMDEAALATFLERFKNEARAAARLHHPNIVQVYDVGEEPDIGPYLVFEYVAGSTLKQIVRSKGALSPERVVTVTEEIAEALTVAHEHDIIHRDIKPDNLLVTPGGQVKLADFGVARVPNAALTREGQFLGTPCYAAPETLSRGQYGPQSDLFSFAAVIYEIASGTRAFPGDDAVSVAHKVVNDIPAKPSEVAKGDPIPPQVDEVIMRGLEKTAAARFESARDLALAVREAYEEAELIAPMPTRTSTRSMKVMTHEQDANGSTFAFGALVVGALAVGVAIIFAFAGTEASGLDDDALVFDAGGDVTEQDTEAPVVDSGVDTEPPSVDTEPPSIDTGMPVADTGGDTGPVEMIEEMSAHEREEAAKDALDAVRAAIGRGDLDGAQTSLEAARRYDPEHPDLAQLEARLNAARDN